MTNRQESPKTNVLQFRPRHTFPTAAPAGELMTDDEARCRLVRGLLCDIEYLVSRVEAVLTIHEIEAGYRKTN